MPTKQQTLQFDYKNEGHQINFELYVLKTIIKGVFFKTGYAVAMVSFYVTK